MAERIIAWRTEHGGFQQIEDLRKVKGIGAKRWQELRRYLR
jgi:competence protein ComEA